MATVFPANLDTFTNPTQNDNVDTVGVKHADQHANANDAIAAIEAKVGKDGSAVTTSHDYKLAQVGDTDWGFTSLFKAASGQRWTYLVPQGGASGSLVGFGDITTLTGTGSAVNPDSTNPNYVNIITSAATTGTDVGWGGNTNYNFARTLRAHFYIKLQETANERYWFGLTDQTATTMAGADDPAGNYAAFRYSSALDTNWRCVTKDNTTQGTSDSAIAVGTTAVLLSLIATPSSVKFYINGTLNTTRTTNLPGSAACRAVAYGETTENVNKNLRVAWIWVEETRS